MAQRVVSGSDDYTLKAWDIDSGEELRTLSGHTSWVNAVAVTPDGKRVVSGSNDKTLKVWDIDNGERLRTLSGHTAWVQGLAVTPDGKRMVSGSRDGILQVWDVESERVIAVFSGNGSINCCATANNGDIILAGDASGQIHMLRLEQAKT